MPTINNDGSTIAGSGNAQATAEGDVRAQQYLLQGTVNDGAHGAIANGNGNVLVADPRINPLMLQISNGAGTCTVTFQGSFDPKFASAQDVSVLGVTELTGASGVDTTRALASGAISVAANKTYVYSTTDIYPYIRAVISAESGLGGGTADTGCTVMAWGAI